MLTTPADADRQDVVQRWLPGIFRPLLHEIRADARSIYLDGVRLYISECGSFCWPVTNESTSAYVYNRCPVCVEAHDNTAITTVTRPGPMP